MNRWWAWLDRVDPQGAMRVLVMVLFLLGLASLLIASCSPARAQEPRLTHAQVVAMTQWQAKTIERAERGILVHEIAVRDWRAAR